VCLGAIALARVVAQQPAAPRAPGASAAESRAQKGGEDVTGPYDVAGNWPVPLGHAGYTWGSMGGIFAESPDRIYVLMRGELPVPEKAPAGYTGGYGAFWSAATTRKPRPQK